MKNGREEIYVCGRELFEKNGFKNTSIADITKMAGIGVGTFYNFYASKEQLFLEIFYNEDTKLKKNVMAAVDLNDDPVHVAREVISMLFEGASSNPILKEWHNRDVYSKLSQLQDSTDLGKEHDEFSYNLFIDLIGKWKTEGKIRSDYSSDLILAMFNSLSYINLHQQEIGAHHFPQMIDCLVEFIVKGLRE